jgi:hypothetical protein
MVCHELHYPVIGTCYVVELLIVKLSDCGKDEKAEISRRPASDSLNRQNSSLLWFFRFHQLTYQRRTNLQLVPRTSFLTSSSTRTKHLQMENVLSYMPVLTHNFSTISDNRPIVNLGGSSECLPVETTIFVHT